MTATCVDHFASSMPSSMPSSGVRKFTPVAWRTNVLSSCNRRPNGRNIWPALTVNLPRIGVSSRYASRFSESSGAIFLVDVQGQELRQQREPRRRPSCARLSVSVSLLGARNVDRRVAAAKIAADGEPAAHDVAGPGRAAFARGRSRAPRSGCAHRACRTELRLPPPLGLTWQLAHFRPLSTARYGSAVPTLGQQRDTRRAAMRRR